MRWLNKLRVSLSQRLLHEARLHYRTGVALIGILLLVVAVTWLLFPQREIPYGPYLSLAALIVIVGWKWLWGVFEHIFELGPFYSVLRGKWSVSVHEAVE